MTVYYNLTDRKPFVKALEKITGTKAIYMKIPTYAYTVDYFTVTRDGNLIFNDMADSDEIERVLTELNQRGFHSEHAEYDECPPESACEEPFDDCPPAYETPEIEPHSESVALTVEVPLENVSVSNLTNLLDAKGYLIKKALGLEALPIEVGSDSVSFPWFSECADADSNLTRTQFIFALCKMSKQQKRINAHEKPADNEKYAFRCFLLRLGFIGDEFKTSRKILLRNFTGSSAFKGGVRNDVSQ